MNWRDLIARIKAAVYPDREAADVIAASTFVPDVSRRTFLKAALITTAIVATVDVEQLLWSPSEKTLFLPTTEDLLVYGNSFVTPDWVTCEALRLLTNNLSVASHFNRFYDDSYLAVGETLSVPVVDKRRFRVAA